MENDYADRNFGGPDLLSDLRDIAAINLRPEDMSVVRLDLVVNHDEPSNKERDMLLSTGTGFIVSDSCNQKALVTCWHNFSGLHHETREWLSPAKCSPTHVIVRNHFKSDNNNGFNTQRFPLMYDGKPAWLVHPRKRNYYDIAALRFDPADPNAHFYPPVSFDAKSLRPLLRTAADVFIVGYPTNDTSNQFVPIWKKGSIASSPQLPVGGHPKFLADSSARAGMSGSPVFLHDKNTMMYIGDRSAGYTDLTGDMRLIGMYSGRIYTSDKSGSSDLGFIWWDDIICDVAFTGVNDCLPESGRPLPKITLEVTGTTMKMSVLDSKLMSAKQGTV